MCTNICFARGLLDIIVLNISPDGFYDKSADCWVSNGVNKRGQLGKFLFKRNSPVPTLITK